MPANDTLLVKVANAIDGTYYYPINALALRPYIEVAQLIAKIAEQTKKEQETK